MKLLFILLFISQFAFSQAVKTPSKITFDAYGKKRQADHETLKAQFVPIAKQFAKQDSSYWKFVSDNIEANGIDLKLVSGHPDSLKITIEGIDLKLRKKK